MFDIPLLTNLFFVEGNWTKEHSLKTSTLAGIGHEKFCSFISFVQKIFPNLTFHKQQNYKWFLDLTGNCHL